MIILAGVQGEREGPAHAHDGGVRAQVQDGFEAAAPGAHDQAPPATAGAPTATSAGPAGGAGGTIAAEWRRPHDTGADRAGGPGAAWDSGDEGNLTCARGRRVEHVQG